MTVKTKFSEAKGAGEAAGASVYTRVEPRNEGEAAHMSSLRQIIVERTALVKRRERSVDTRVEPRNEGEAAHMRSLRQIIVERTALVKRRERNADTRVEPSKARARQRICVV